MPLKKKERHGDVSLTLTYDPPVVLGTPTAAQETPTAAQEMATAAQEMATWVLLRLRAEFTTEIRRVVEGGAE